MDMETELRGTCHFARVNDVIFPAGCSDLFITCSVADIRVWNAALRQELLRIQVPRVCVFFLPAMAGKNYESRRHPSCLFPLFYTFPKCFSSRKSTLPGRCAVQIETGPFGGDRPWVHSRGSECAHIMMAPFPVTFPWST